MHGILNHTNLVKPYDPRTFARQLREMGLPETSIGELLDEVVQRPREPHRLERLFADIASREAWIEDGERRSVVAGVFVTDGYHVLVERSTELGHHGELFKLGGQLPADADPRECAAREVCEETPLRPRPEDLQSLAVTIEVAATSPKLPGVPARKHIHHFLLRIPSLLDIAPGDHFTHQGSDGEFHDLRVLTIERALTDPILRLSYRTTLREYVAAISARP